MAMIQSFSCKDTQALFEGRCPPRFSAIRTVAERKLGQLDAAKTLGFLWSPPGNKLEKLLGDRPEQYSIRINSQWRVCFVWTAQGPAEVEIIDYH
jgi:proteic killer suppression protein